MFLKLLQQKHWGRKKLKMEQMSLPALSVKKVLSLSKNCKRKRLKFVKSYPNDVTADKDADLSGYDRIGFASGIYYSSFAKQIIAFAEKNLPDEKPVFFIYTHGAPKGDFLKGIRAVTQGKNCPEIGEFRCQGYDTFGPFKLVGGIAKGHPTEDEIRKAVEFYQNLQ